MSPRGSGGTRAAIRSMRESEDFGKLLAMMGLSFTVIFVIGMLRPIRDAMALDGLPPGDFYQVYLISGLVVLFAPIFNRLADRYSWRTVIPSLAVFFALSMIVFRLLYVPGSAAFGLGFYGWYDLVAAALVTQFWMATQLFYNARDAKRAYPIVIAAGSVGATVGGAVTAIFAPRVGTPNLLFVVAAAILVFAVGIALVWAKEDPEIETGAGSHEAEERTAGDLKRVFGQPQVRLIALTVLLTVLVKQFIDYEYKTLSREFYSDLDALSGFFGLVDAATQWLPILVLLALRPILRRFGARVAVLIFPIAVILALGSMAVYLTLAVAVVARTGEKMFRYSAERTGREILYVPVPDEIKLKAKAYIDVAVEKGFGKFLSGVFVAIPALLLPAVGVRTRLTIVAFVGLAVALLLLFVFLRARSEYVATLARSFEGRFTSLQGTYVSLADVGALDLAREALGRPEPLRVHFALELLDGADESELADLGPELHALLDRDVPEIRAGALRALARAPSAVDVERVRRLLEDDDPVVRRHAVRTLALGSEDGFETVLRGLLESEDPRVRVATLAALAHDIPPQDAGPIAHPHFQRLRETGRAGDRGRDLELAATAGLIVHDPQAVEVLHRLIAHEDDEVAAMAVRGAGRGAHDSLIADIIGALGQARTRHAARDALAGRGVKVQGQLITALNDAALPLWTRCGVARVLGDIHTPVTVDALITSYLDPETEQALDDRALAALGRLRSTDGALSFPEDRIQEAIDREVGAIRRYTRAAAAVAGLEPSLPQELLARALREALIDRQASVFDWLGLIFPQEGMHRTRLALGGADDRRRANAIEWLESTVGHSVFVRLGPIVGRGPGEAKTTKVGDLLRELWDDEDVWIARCALWTSFRIEANHVLDRLSGYAPSDPGLERVIARIEERAREAGVRHAREESRDMDLIEKVFLLQGIDLLSGIRSQQLALLASIARELEAAAGETLFEKGEPTDALYVVIQGEVTLDGMEDQRVSVTDGGGFGTWALIDEQPSLMEARAASATRLLKISRVDFRDLLVDHPELGLDLLQGLARRVRSLATA